jgi:adenosine deaminase
MPNLNIRSLPKVSLHDHLDGGLRPQTIIELAAEIGHELPADNARDLNKWFLDSCDSGSLVRYLETFVHTCAVMQTKEGLIRVAREFALDLAADGVIYGEVRYAPEQHLERGLSLEDVVEYVEEGLSQGRAEVSANGGYLVTGQLITAMRQNDRAQEIAELAVAYRDRGAVGFDYAGPEDGFSPSRHAETFQWLNQQLMPVTLHAGEAAGRDSIKDALVDGRTLRLGHGVRIIEDIFVDAEDENQKAFGDVAAWVLERGIALELSPSSNLQTGALPDIEQPQMSDHPFDILYGLGFNVTVNTDNRLMSGTTLTRELELLTETFGYDLDDLELFQLNAANAGFMDMDVRAEIIERISDAFEAAQ